MYIAGTGLGDETVSGEEELSAGAVLASGWGKGSAILGFQALSW